MKYPKIAALVPANEHFDESAIVNEGGYLSTAHLAAIEKKFSDDATLIAAQPAELKKVQDQAAASIAAKKVAEDALAAANKTIEDNTTKITNLEAEVAKLKKDTAPFSSTTKETDPPVTTSQNEKNKYRTSYDDMADAYAEKNN